MRNLPDFCIGSDADSRHGRTTEFVIGPVCEKHPEVAGRRYARCGRCPECRREEQKADYHKYRERRLAVNRIWRNANKAKHKALKERWVKEYPDRRAGLEALVRARKRARASNLPFDITIDWFLGRVNSPCAYCGETMIRAKGKGPAHHSPSIDQLIPGAGYTQTNARVICHWCNSHKGDMTLQTG